jgi:hypothetical protein
MAARTPFGRQEEVVQSLFFRVRFGRTGSRVKLAKRTVQPNEEEESKTLPFHMICRL